MLGTKTPTEVVAALAIVVGDSLNFFLSLSPPFTSCCLFAGCVPCDTNALCAAHRPPLFSQFQCPWLRQFAFHWGCCCCCKNWCNVLSNVLHSLLSQCFYTHTHKLMTTIIEIIDAWWPSKDTTTTTKSGRHHHFCCHQLIQEMKRAQIETIANLAATEDKQSTATTASQSHKTLFHSAFFDNVYLNCFIIKLLQINLN